MDIHYTRRKDFCDSWYNTLPGYSLEYNHHILRTGSADSVDGAASAVLDPVRAVPQTSHTAHTNDRPEGPSADTQGTKLEKSNPDQVQ